MADIKQLAGPQSRRKFLAVGGGSTALAAFLAACGSDSDSSTMDTTAMKPAGKSETAQFGKGDVGILNYALTLEYLEAAFYDEATASGKITDPLTAKFLAVVTRDENAHVEALKQALGSKAVRKPKFDFKGTTSDQAMFQATAQVLENTGVHAYFGQGFNIKKPAYLKAAISILTVEARHAGVIGLINGGSAKDIAPDGPFDTPYTAAKVLKAVKATGFIVG
jgi:rubrerythrin